MSSTKHTPGPWLFRGKSSSIHSAPPADTSYQYGEALARFAEDDNACADVGDADLALILAAPDLLEACEMAERFMRAIDVDAGDYSAYRSDFDAIVAAIKRARGEP